MLTQTRPCPPPAAGVAVAAVAALVPVEVGVPGAAEDTGLEDAFGLKKSASVFFAGEADGVTVGEAAVEALLLRLCFSAGEGDASVVAAGEPAVSGAAASLAAFFL